jgi:3-hydroxyisobutyrate dehydrogenase-like beta-hydroxyacid dehydrogenase
VQAQAERLALLGIGCIDAPMSGGPLRAQDGSMSLMVACSDALWARSQNLLNALSQKVFRVGTRAGDGARTKLVNNLLAAVNLVGAAEAMALAERLGLDPKATLSVIEASSGQSWIGSDRMHRALQDDFAPRAHVTLLAKDTGLAVQAAEEAGFDPPLGRLAKDLFAQALGKGWADLDDAALLQLMRQR